MRISSILRVVEDQVIHTSGRVATVTKVAVREIDRELQIRALYAIEAHQQKKERLAELRAVIKAADDLHAYKSSAEFVEAIGWLPTVGNATVSAGRPADATGGAAAGVTT